MPTDDLVALRDALRVFAHERNWEQFHTPRNLALALGGELGELFEHLQWRTDAQLTPPLDDQTLREGLEEELADVLIYLVRLADVLNVDLLAAAHTKLASNEARYPASEVRGSAAKRARDASS